MLLWCIGEVCGLWFVCVRVKEWLLSYFISLREPAEADIISLLKPLPATSTSHSHAHVAEPLPHDALVEFSSHCNSTAPTQTLSTAPRITYYAPTDLDSASPAQLSTIMSDAYERERQNNSRLTELSAKVAALRDVTVDIYDNARAQDVIDDTVRPLLRISALPLRPGFRCVCWCVCACV